MDRQIKYTNVSVGSKGNIRRMAEYLINLMLAIEKHVPERWCLLYIQRWLTMPVQSKSGELIQKQGKGTPQGGIINPLLANENGTSVTKPI